MTDLDTRLCAAHAAGDEPALVDLYTLTADAAPTLDAACFYLTQAYIFGLELGHPAVPALHDRLKTHGRV